MVFTYTNSNNTRGERAPMGGGTGGTHGCWDPSEGSSMGGGPKGVGTSDGVHLHQQQQHPR